MRKHHCLRSLPPDLIRTPTTNPSVSILYHVLPLNIRHSANPSDLLWTFLLAKTASVVLFLGIKPNFCSLRWTTCLSFASWTFSCTFVILLAVTKTHYITLVIGNQYQYFLHSLGIISVSITVVIKVHLSLLNIARPQWVYILPNSVSVFNQPTFPTTIIISPRLCSSYCSSSLTISLTVFLSFCIISLSIRLFLLNNFQR